jgi:hypothetical protein
MLKGSPKIMLCFFNKELCFLKLVEPTWQLAALYRLKLLKLLILGLNMSLNRKLNGFSDGNIILFCNLLFSEADFVALRSL